MKISLGKPVFDEEMETAAVDAQPVYREMFGFREGMYPCAEELCKTCLSIPIYPDISGDEVQYISHNIRSFFENT
jgi:dTDP-4-amino-4,6-dideoxygalactose transaminase